MIYVIPVPFFHLPYPHSQISAWLLQILSFGAQGTGKTTTMRGEGGVVLQAAADVFKALGNQSSGVFFLRLR